MGTLEKESKKRARKANLQKIILRVIAVAGGLSVALVAPNAMCILEMFDGGKKRKRRFESIQTSRQKLVDNGLLEYSREGFLVLTEKGEAKLRQLELHEYKIKKPKKWDKKWRVLIFDIDEERKVLRNKVRNTLIAIGFMWLQDSVWVYPHDCEDLVTLLKADFKIGTELLYMIVDSIEYDQSIKEYFGIK